MMSLGRIGFPARGDPSGAAGLINTCRFQLCNLPQASVVSCSGSTLAAMVSQVSLAWGMMVLRLSVRSDMDALPSVDCLRVTCCFICRNQIN